MQVKQVVVAHDGEFGAALAALTAIQPNLILVFGDVGHFAAQGTVDRLRAALPQTTIVGCSTAGEITAEGVSERTCTLTALRLDKVVLTTASARLHAMQDSRAAGRQLGASLATPDLKAILIFGPGLQINGSALLDGVTEVVGMAIPITGGLAGDGGAFRQTFTIGPEGVADNVVVAVGLHGDALRFGHGSFGGWEAFGPARKVSRCEGNVLYELDDEPALEIYKRYLGEHAKGLPASGLLFPFAMLGQDHDALGLIRTILGVDEASGSLTLAGEINANGYLKLMHASTDKLDDGAEAAAEAAAAMTGQTQEQLAILVSCVGRKLVMGHRVDEEVEAVADVLGSHAVLTGFYSYGEISPCTPGGPCKLHNQTMTITTLRED